jgi:protein-arginine kinase activator protein McsA
MSARLSAKRKIGELGAKLKKMIADQNFEEAAAIRDEINKIKSESGGELA